MSNTTTTIKAHSTGVPICRACAHHDLESITEDLANGTPVAVVAQKYNLSRDSLYRHQKNHAPLRVLQSADDSNTALPLVDRVLGVLDRARTASEIAYDRGDLKLGGLLGDSAVRDVNALSSLGITSEKIAADYRQAGEKHHRAVALSRAVEQTVNLHPAIAADLADAMDEQGLTSDAASLRSQLAAEDSADLDPDLDTLEMNR